MNSGVRSETGVSPGGFLAAVAGLEGMGPARLGSLLMVCAAEEIWSRLDSGSIGAIAGEACSEGSDVRPVGDSATLFEDQSRPQRRLFPRSVLDQWKREVRSTPHTPAEMERRIAALELFVLSGEDLPGVLREDPDPAAVLFSTSPNLLTTRPRVAIVGTRKASEYGLRTARCLGLDLASAGVEVVSGLALGIDAAAHAGALDRPDRGCGTGAGPPLIAVIGAGHDRPCPTRNRALARAVSSCGTILSEVPPGIRSAPWRYPIRNRLIAALADVVVVVESASSGGSMSTVAEALVRNRVVMAVPGAVGRRTAQGCHDLLRDGAEICTGAEDVMAALGLLGFSAVCESPPSGSDADERAAGTAVPGTTVPGGTVPGTTVSSGTVPGGTVPAGAVDGGAVDGGTVEGGDVILDLLIDGPATLDGLLSRSGWSPAELAGPLSALQSVGLITTDAGWVRRLA